MTGRAARVRSDAGTCTFALGPVQAVCGHLLQAAYAGVLLVAIVSVAASFMLNRRAAAARTRTAAAPRL